jgi:Holliday junction resolvase RusA-like endonuclease
MQQKVTIIGTFPTLNDMIGDARKHWAISAKHKKESTELARVQCLRLKRVTRPCELSFHWFYSSRCDPDNTSSGGRKSCLDGMVEAGVLPNDNDKWIIGFGKESFTKVKKGQEKVVVTITEIM